MKRGGRRGHTMVEFAMAYLILFTMFTGAVQFGRTYFVYNNLLTAVRAGARYASLRTFDSGTGSPSQDYTTAVCNTVLYGNPAGGTVALVSGLTATNVNVSVTVANNVPTAVTVSIQSFTMDALFARFTFNAKPKVTLPYLGRYAPA